MIKLNKNQIKYIALLAMLLDHIAAFLIPPKFPLRFILRTLGRMSASIFCFFLTEGFIHTTEKKKYALRLFIFAVISQIAFSYANYNQIFTFKLNMIFTLFISFLILIIYKEIKNIILKTITIIILIMTTNFSDWGIIAPIWILTFYIFKNNKLKQLISYSIVTISFIIKTLIKYYHHTQLCQLGLLLTIPIIYLYDNKKIKTTKFNKWIFYYFYPLHFTILKIIKMYIY